MAEPLITKKITEVQQFAEANGNILQVQNASLGQTPIQVMKQEIVAELLTEDGVSLNLVNLKGVLDEISDLPITSNINDAYQIVNNNNLVSVWDGTRWVNDFTIFEEPTGVVEQGNINAVSGGEVFKSLPNGIVKVFKSEIINTFNKSVTIEGSFKNTNFIGYEIELPKTWDKITLKLPNSSSAGVNIGGVFYSSLTGDIITVNRRDIGDFYNVNGCMTKSNLSDFFIKIQASNDFNIINCNELITKDEFLFSKAINVNQFIYCSNNTIIYRDNLKTTIYQDTNIGRITGLSVIDNNILITHLKDNKTVISYYTITNGVVSFSNDVIFDENLKFSVINDVLKNESNIYILLDVRGTISNNTPTEAIAEFRTLLYSFSNGELSNKIVVSENTETFAKSFTNSEGVLKLGLNGTVTLNYSKFYKNKGKIYITQVCKRDFRRYNAKLFIKEFTPLSNKVTPMYIGSELRAYSASIIDDTDIVLCKRYYESNNRLFNTWSNTKNTLYDLKTKKEYNILNDVTDFLEVTNYHKFGDDIYLKQTHNSNSNIKSIFIHKKLNELFSFIYPSKKYNGSLNNVGDTIESLGKTDYIDSFYFNENADKQYNYITSNVGEVKEITFNGFSYIQNIKYDLGKSKFLNNYLCQFAENNVFLSRMFRIPILNRLTNGYLISGFDIRYCSGEDYDLISGGINISKDGGRTWGDNKIVFPRIEEPGYRTHDLSIVVDTDIRSTNYGRVWAIAKSWNANVNSTNTQYWKDNPQSYDMLMSYSDDNGITWVTPYSIKSLFVGKYMYSSGCQAGITIKNGSLCIPVYAIDLNTNKSDVAVLYKELNNNVWKLSNWSINIPYDLNENSIIEDKDGTLIASCRSTTDNRYWLRMSDLTSNFVLDNNIGVKKDVICQASFFRYRDTYLYVAPDFDKNTNNSRRFITVFYSYDLVNWFKMVDLNGNVNGGGYSSIYVDDNIFCALYETNGIYSVDLNNYRNLLR